MYSFRGKNYNSKYEIALEYGQDPSLFYNRLNRGWTMDEILNGVRDERVIEFNGKTYRSKNAAAKDNHMSIGKFNRIYNSGKRTSEICIDGVYYNTKSEAMKKLKITRTQLSQILEEQEDNKHEEIGRIIIFDKKLNKKISFINERSLCNYYNFNFNEFLELLKTKDIQEIVDNYLKNSDE